MLRGSHTSIAPGAALIERGSSLMTQGWPVGEAAVWTRACAQARAVSSRMITLGSGWPVGGERPARREVLSTSSIGGTEAPSARQGPRHARALSRSAEP